jgi:transposase-like protein
MRKIIDESAGNEMLMTIEKDRIPAQKYGGKHRNWTDEQKLEMNQMYKSGVSIKDISTHFSCSTSTIGRIVRNER